jgi:phospholipid transport system substrate-binding protein
MSVRRVALVVTAAITLAAAAVGSARAGLPTEQLRQRVERVVQIIEDPGLASRPAERRAAVRRVADEIFDWRETARRSLGRHWADRTPAEQDEFVALFAALVERSYVSRIDLYDRERIAYVGESIEGGEGLVRTAVTTRAGSEIALDYRLHLAGPDQWKVYDLQIAGVSLVANYRTQFDKIIRTASWGDLLSRLRARAREEAAPAGVRPAR